MILLYAFILLFFVSFVGYAYKNNFKEQREKHNEGAAAVAGVLMMLFGLLEFGTILFILYLLGSMIYNML